MIVTQILKNLIPGVLHIEPVSGGDINSCYKLVSDRRIYFLKLNSEKKFPGMFKCEADALLLLKSTNTFEVPRVIATGALHDFQYLILEWSERSQKNNWEEAGRLLAMLHKNTNSYFGSENDNYIGSLGQINTWKESWKEFFGECRLLPMLQKLQDVLNEEDRRRVFNLLAKTDNYFPAEKPSMLHGDLWSGNMMFTEDGPCIYDPALYYGHREMDIGMTKLFGGFPGAFYNAYNEIYPLEKNWEKRIELTQLYPLMVHANLFGGTYVNSVKQILKKYS